MNSKLKELAQKHYEQGIRVWEAREQLQREKDAASDIESSICSELVESGRSDLLRVHWNRLHRALKDK